MVEHGTVGDNGRGGRPQPVQCPGSMWGTDVIAKVLDWGKRTARRRERAAFTFKVQTDISMGVLKV